MTRVHQGLVARAVTASLAAGLIIVSNSVGAADVERGGRLYETRCNACHTTSVHNRSARKAKSFDRLRAQVERWSGEVGGDWTAAEVDDITV
ncbi:MAG: hypothetical protein ABIH03_01215, partial [Pseudomonadota bacterium]